MDFEEFNQPQTPDQSLRKTLNKMFSRYDYVGVSNPLKGQFTWVVALEQNEIIGMSQADPMDEGKMAQSQGGTFLPGDGATRVQQRVTKVVLKPGEKRMIPGEAAYVVVPRLFNALVRQKYGTDKPALARLRNPSTQKELLPSIVTGPVVNNVGQAVQTYVNEQMGKIEGFTDVQAKPKGFNDPAILEKAKATREANKAARTQQGNNGTSSVS